MEELVRAEPQQVGEVGIEADEAAAHAIAEHGVKPAPAAQHPIEEFLRPATVAGVEVRRPAVEGRVEQQAGPKVREHRGGGDTRLRDADDGAAEG